MRRRLRFGMGLVLINLLAAIVIAALAYFFFMNTFGYIPSPFTVNDRMIEELEAP